MRPARRGARLAIIACALVLAASGAWLRFIGTPGVFVEPTLPDQLPGPSRVIPGQTLIGVIPLGAALLLLAGLGRRRRAWLWAGVALTAAYSLLLLFSSGGILLPLVPLLAVAATLAKVQEP